ncbi:MAG: PfkB family carbohydrate kinase [Thermoprotei archaeon]
MKLVIAGFITIDEIILREKRFTSLGGSPSYAGFAATIFNANVKAVSRIGYDFPEEYLRMFFEKNISLGKNYRSLTARTTKFRIKIINNERELKLLYKCDEPDVNELLVDADALILNSITGELKFNSIKDFVTNFPIKYLDPQGYLRTFTSDGTVKLKRPNDISFIKYFDVIKVDTEEAPILAETKNPIEAASKISNYGNNIVLLTMGENGVIIMKKNNAYFMPAPNISIIENTGMGDILGGITIAEYVKSDDILWATALGMAGSALAGSSKLYGINKIMNLNQNDIIDLAQNIYEKYKKL